MTREILLYERLYHDRRGHRFRLHYFLLIDEVYFGVNTLEVYGVKVAQYRDEEFLLQRSVRGVTPFGTTVMAILNRLSDSLTPPSRMERMIEDAVFTN